MNLVTLVTVLLLSALAAAKTCNNVPAGDEFIANMNPDKVSYKKGELASYACTKENYHIFGASDDVVVDSIKCVGKPGAKEWNQPRPHCVPNSACSCGSGWIYGPPGLPSCYKFMISDPKNWTAAGDSCKAMGGHLLILESEEEIIWMRGYRAYHAPLADIYFWISGYDKGGVWHWISDEGDTPILHFDWGGGQPDSGDGPQDCLALFQMSGYWTWDDGTCEYAHPYICEKDQD